MQGRWLGEIKGIQVREPAKDADGPILEIYGEEAMAAVEVGDIEDVEGLEMSMEEIRAVLEDEDD